MNDEEEISKLILQESKKIQNILNDDLLNKFSKLHNTNEKFNFLNLKQEVIAKNAYFLEVKKKYALHIINEEGKKVDDYVLKGLITQRSDYPPITKKYIRKLIDLLIKEDKVSYKKIKTYIEEKRQELLELCIKGDKTIGRPVSFSRKLKEYKTIPGHVHGMILWNELMYPIFTHGVKGYLFKIKGIDTFNAPIKIKEKIKIFEKSKGKGAIVLPYEEKKLPSFFKIDVEAQMKLAWDDRVKELLYPIESVVYKDNKMKTEVLTW